MHIRRKAAARRRADYVDVTASEPLRTLPVRERLWAALVLQTANNPHRAWLHWAAQTQLDRARRVGVRWIDVTISGVVVVLQRTFHGLTPPRSRYRGTPGRASAGRSRTDLTLQHGVDATACWGLSTRSSR